MVYCFGNNRNGELGLGSRVEVIGDEAREVGSFSKGVLLGPLNEVLKVVSGSGHNCVVFKNEQVKCWGANNDGQLGFGDYNPRGLDLMTMGDNLPYVDFSKFWSKEQENSQ